MGRKKKVVEDIGVKVEVKLAPAKSKKVLPKDGIEKHPKFDKFKGEK